jgi:hypothetical protein
MRILMNVRDRGKEAYLMSEDDVNGLKKYVVDSWVLYRRENDITLVGCHYRRCGVMFRVSVKGFKRYISNLRTLHHPLEGMLSIRMAASHLRCQLTMVKGKKQFLASQFSPRWNIRQCEFTNSIYHECRSWKTS